MSPAIRWGLFWGLNFCATLAATIAWESEERQWLALAIAVVLGAYLGVFVAAGRSGSPGNKDHLGAVAGGARLGRPSNGFERCGRRSGGSPSWEPTWL